MKTRRVLQIGFLALTLVGVFVVKGNAERWCPFGGVEAIYTYVTEGNMLCSLGVSNFYILGGVLLGTVILRRAFCGYACPIGAISEWIHSGAGWLGLRQAKVPYPWDRALSKLKYVVLVVILFFTWRYAELEFRVADPCYALLSRHGEDITYWAYVVAGAILVSSLFLMVPFCRWLCPLAAVFHPFSRFGFTRVKRDEDACVGCGVCAKVCPTMIPVDQVEQVTAARCLSCMTCVDACPKLADGALSWGPPKRWGGHWPQSALVATFLLCITAAVAAAYAFPIPSFVKERGVAPATAQTVELEVTNLTCRGRATLFAYFVERDDVYAIPGYLRIEAWPGPGEAPVKITFDPAEAEDTTVKQAITEPYFDALAGRWRPSPFGVVGYDPLDISDVEVESPAD